MYGIKALQMCTLTGYFVYADGTSITGCNVISANAVALHCVVNTSSFIGEQLYAVMTYRDNSDNLQTLYSLTITVTRNTTVFTAELPELQGGIYSIYNFDIYNTSNQLLCFGPGTGSGLCENILVTEVSTCRLNYGYFVHYDGTKISDCSNTSDSIALQCTASFRGTYVGKKMYAVMTYRDHSGSLQNISSPVVTAVANTTFLAALPTLSPGTYSTYNFAIYNAWGLIVCQGLGSGSGTCENIIITDTNTTPTATSMTTMANPFIATTTMCAANYEYFMLSGGNTIASNCYVNLTDIIELHGDAQNFDTTYMNKQVYAKLSYKDPSGISNTLTSPTVTVPNYSSPEVVFKVNLPALTAGTYTTNGFSVWDAATNTQICTNATPGTYTGLCNSFTVCPALNTSFGIL